MSFPKLRPEVKTAWLKALRSGRYVQGRSWLRSRESGVDRFCCLGVLCEIAADQGVTDRAGYRPDGDIFAYDGEDAFPPQTVIAWAYDGDVDEPWQVLSDESVKLALSGLNDNGMSFDEIADRIKESL